MRDTRVGTNAEPGSCPLDQTHQLISAGFSPNGGHRHPNLPHKPNSRPRISHAGISTVRFGFQALAGFCSFNFAVSPPTCS